MFSLSRRRFLEAAGFAVTMAAAQGCRREQPENALPYVVAPEGITPGKSQSYATTCSGCPAGCGVLASVRDGRPLKMEGLPEHPLSRGGLCAVGQALPLSLYDSHRLKNPLKEGEKTDWETADQEIAKSLDQIREKKGSVRLLTSTVTSPTLQQSIDAFLETFDDGRQITLDAMSSSSILAAHELTHGIHLLPHYDFSKAEVIVSFGADFLGTWISPVEFTAAWSSRRVPTPDHPSMSYHAQLEGRMSLTGGNADHRIRLAPDEYGATLVHLKKQLARKTGTGIATEELPTSPLPNDELDDLVSRLWAARGASLVVCDSQDVSVQTQVNAINELLGNYGKTVDLAQPSFQRQGDDRALIELMEDLKAGKISALFVAGTDLTHSFPNRKVLESAIEKIDLVVSLAEREDDFASLAHWVCPDHHSLESWLDAEPVAGLINLYQPLVRPLGDTRSILESLASWSGQKETAYNLLRKNWQQNIFPRAKDKPASFRTFWDQTLHDGFTEATSEEVAGEFDPAGITPPNSESRSEYCLELYQKIAFPDARHAHNPWLQELPDPTSKVTWDNYVCVSTTMAKTSGIGTGDVVQIASSDGAVQLELPANVQPGQHDRVISVALAYGVKGTERFAKIGPQWLEARPTVAQGEQVGKNAAPFIAVRNGVVDYLRSDVQITKTGSRRQLATTQQHHSLEVPKHVAPHGAEMREPIQETTLAEFSDDPSSGKPHLHHHEGGELWPDDHKPANHEWGMVIDLNACTGCSSCLIACQSENNVPVAGKDEVQRQREMHWIRIDRYFTGEGDDVDVTHQPMMCQHCDNAPCETVCPVLATVHSEEGLNEQAYNRCVGTRYCANNCPYKVRRFNWFDYPQPGELETLVLNPDVTVRSRGVMEKCSMCVQRINEGKIEAQRLGQSVLDGQIQTACQQSCPSQAITFGDLQNSESEVSVAMKSPRRYGVLEEFNFRPSVSYLRMVRNRESDATGSGGDHHTQGGDHE